MKRLISFMLLIGTLSVSSIALCMAPPPPPPKISMAAWEKDQKPFKNKDLNRKPVQKKSAPPMDLQAALNKSPQFLAKAAECENVSSVQNAPENNAKKESGKTPIKKAPGNVNPAPNKTIGSPANNNNEPLKAPAPKTPANTAPKGAKKNPKNTGLKAKRAPQKANINYQPSQRPIPVGRPVKIPGAIPQASLNAENNAVPQKDDVNIGFAPDMQSFLISASLFAGLYYLQNPEPLEKLKKKYPKSTDFALLFGQHMLAANAAQQLLPGQPANTAVFSATFALLHIIETLAKEAVSKLIKKDPLKKLSVRSRENIKKIGVLCSWTIKTFAAREIANRFEHREG